MALQYRLHLGLQYPMQLSSTPGKVVFFMAFSQTKLALSCLPMTEILKTVPQTYQQQGDSVMKLTPVHNINKHKQTFYERGNGILGQVCSAQQENHTLNGLNFKSSFNSKSFLTFLIFFTPKLGTLCFVHNSSLAQYKMDFLSKFL